MKPEKKSMYRSKKEILHEFRPKENDTDTPLIPIVFSVGAIVLLIIFLSFACSAGGNLKNFGGFWSLVFFLGLVGVAVFYYLFWTTINM